MIKELRLTIFVIICTLAFSLVFKGQTPILKKFLRTPCIENCKKYDTVYSKKYLDKVFTINFGRREACDNYDTALVRFKNDTLLIVIGEKKLLSTKTNNGKTSPCFIPSDEEDCECFYDYFMDVTNLPSEPKALIVDRQLYIEGKGFSIKRYNSIW